MVRKRSYNPYGGIGTFDFGEKTPTLPSLNIIDLRSSKTKYIETKKDVDKRLENMRYEPKLGRLKEAQKTLEREHPTSIQGFVKKGFRKIFNF